jgi:hypothetical protein
MRKHLRNLFRFCLSPQVGLKGNYKGKPPPVGVYIVYHFWNNSQASILGGCNCRHIWYNRCINGREAMNTIKLKYFRVVLNNHKSLFFYAKSEGDLLHQFSNHYTGKLEDISFFEEVPEPKDPKDRKGEIL